MTISKEKQLQQFIEKALRKYGTIYNYEKVVYVNSRTRVSIICAIHGEFTQTPSHHLISNGCHKCTYIINGKNNRNTTDEFIVKAKQKHGDRYDYTNTIYVFYSSSSIIILPLLGSPYLIMSVLRSDTSLSDTCSSITL